ncbi:DUF7373 family lipoprotein [Nocardia veterana]|uniref:Uncharacterized protein n=1 Tax=Nocardia veterana TaxID=132249 RepID=A0A7X6M4S9_9NOCA|nr:hypothetical protein [Nocardia veterana]NKY89187.1 hypothetical protein [Nocardia veterana]
MVRNKNLRTLLSIAFLLITTGCGAIEPGLPTAGEIDVRHLDTGQYPIEPIDTYKEYGHSYNNGAELAAMRLADNMATGLDIDPKLKFGTSAESIVPELDDPAIAVDTLSLILARDSAAAAIRNHMLYGFSSGSSDHEPDRTGKTLSAATMLTLVVMQFPSKESASRAATEIEQADFDAARETNRPITLDKYPEAHSHWQPGISSLGSFLAHGNYVVALFGKLPEGGAPELASFAEKAYDKQVPRLDKLEPVTPEDVVKSSPPDDGMVRRIINPDKSYSFYKDSLATFGLQGFLHFQSDRAAAEKLFATIHIDRFALSTAYLTISTNYDRTANTQAFAGKEIAKNVNGGAILYRSPDVASARDAWEKLLQQPDAQMQPRNLPDSKCAKLPEDGYYRQFSCAIRYRQYVAVVWGRQLDDAQQRASAQYALLANSQGM